MKHSWMFILALSIHLNANAETEKQISIQDIRLSNNTPQPEDELDSRFKTLTQFQKEEALKQSKNVQNQIDPTLPPPYKSLGDIEREQAMKRYQGQKEQSFTLTTN